MMSTRQKLVVSMIAIAALVGCKGDGTLLDLYPLKPIVNPEIRALIVENHLIHARLDARQRIKGVTMEGGFATADRFRSFDFERYAWQGGQGPVRFRDDMVVNAETDGGAFVLNYSKDYGKHWEVFTESVVADGIPASGTVYVMDVFIKSDDAVLLAIRYESVTGRRLLLYRVDLGMKTSELLFSKAGAMPLAIDFADNGSTGWLLLAQSNGRTGDVHVLKTSNGGETWSAGAILSGIVVSSVKVMAGGNLLVYDETGNAFYSEDGGESFSATSVGERLVTLQAGSADVVYALLSDGMKKSVDGGHTWAHLTTHVQGVDVSGVAMHFRNAVNGIVYGPDRMFITDDGGENWQILVYPYDYVFE